MDFFVYKEFLSLTQSKHEVIAKKNTTVVSEMSSLTRDLHTHGTSASWAGEFDCAVCRRKRLIAAEFSQNQLKQKRADSAFQIKCKTCVSKEAEKEKAAAREKAASGGSIGFETREGRGSDAAVDENFTCATCKKELGAACFTKNQLNKARRCQSDTMKCKTCAEGAEAATVAAAADAKQQRMASLKEAARRAEATGTNAEKLAAAAALCAAEAELVTGIKPTKLGKGRRGAGGRNGGKGKGGGKGVGSGGKPRSLASLSNAGGRKK